ncbi:MAG TPA: mechanosensitive ion channel family protein [Steroidobacteraceae bacterium]|nr:mechanosensitive ion channel family protein [Steroidobacteraceae bacterium]
MNEQVATIGHARDTMLDLALRFGPRLLTAVLILVAGFIVANWVSGAFTRMLERRELEPPVRALFTRFVWALCVLLFAIMALQNLGVELLPLVAGLSVVGAGVALATQGVLSNVVAGLSIIFAKPFKVGEYIAIAGVEGAVDDISLSSTTLMHADRSRVVIPNRKIVGEILHNYGRVRQLDVTVGVAYDTDLTAALAAIREVLAANPRILKDPPAVVAPLQLGESGVALAVRPWVLVEDQGAAGGEVCEAVLAAFRARGVSRPVPQREVRILGGQP